MESEQSVAEYESEREQAWSALAHEAHESQVFQIASNYLGRKRGAAAALLEGYLRSAPDAERARLERDPDYFVDRVENIVSGLAPVREFEHVLARRMAAFLRSARGRGDAGAREDYDLKRTAMRMTTRVDVALQAHDAYREFRCRVLPQTRNLRGP